MSAQERLDKAALLALASLPLPEIDWHEVSVRMREHRVNDALDAAQLAIDEYYNGDREWAEQWLLRAFEANQKESAE